jgi:hypothetical protein
MMPPLFAIPARCDGVIDGRAASLDKLVLQGLPSLVAWRESGASAWLSKCTPKAQDEEAAFFTIDRE